VRHACFEVDLFQSNLFSILDFTTRYILHFRSLLKNTCSIASVIYLAELLVVTTCNICL